MLKCNWSPDGRRVASGSADRFVYVWDTTTRQILYKLPGHVGAVNEVGLKLLISVASFMSLSHSAMALFAQSSNYESDYTSHQILSSAVIVQTTS